MIKSKSGTTNIDFFKNLISVSQQNYRAAIAIVHISDYIY